MDRTKVIEQIEEAISAAHRGDDSYMAASIAGDRILRMRQQKGWLTQRGQYYASKTAMPSHEQESATPLFR